MKQQLILFSICLLLQCVHFDAGAQNVGIGTITPDASALLDISSSNKGVLVPRLDAAQRNAIASPAKGLLVFITTDSSFYYYDGAWQKMGAASNTWGLQGNAGTNETHFIGTTDAKPLQFRVNNLPAGFLDENRLNSFIGVLAGQGSAAQSYAGVTGTVNVGVGSLSLNSLTTGRFNNGIGGLALKSNTTGEYNNALGTNALFTNINGSYNTAIGDFTQFFSTGSFNTSLGAATLVRNQVGERLLALGTNADVSRDGLTNATAVGPNSMVDCSNCLVLGSVAGFNNATSNVNVGIGITNPQAPLQFATEIRNRKIVLWSNQDNDNHFNGFGINPFILRYQVNTVNDNHVFYAGTSPTTSNELMRISGNGNVGIGTSMPTEKLDVAGNAKIADTLMVAAIAQDPVQNLPLVNSWIDYGFGFEGAGFYKDRESRVHLSGLIKGGTITTGTLLFQLPATARPTGRLMFTVENNGSSGRIDILSNGDVLLMTATNNAFLNLTGISFRAD